MTKKVANLYDNEAALRILDGAGIHSVVAASFIDNTTARLWADAAHHMRELRYHLDPTYRGILDD